ncbi:hypothetical protein DFP72DRAFT_787883, partial [Ephemerocybe angulata]
MTGETIPETTFDSSTSAVAVKKTHPKMTHFTDIITFLVKCNMDIKFIGSGPDASAFVYYCTDYITKPSLSMHVGLSALSHAINRIEDRRKRQVNAESPESDESQLASAMTIAVNSMMGHQEISHQQVMSYIVGSGDHYTSELFAPMNWWSISHHVEEFCRRVDQTGDFVPLDNVSLQVTSEGKLTVCNSRLDYCLRSNEAEISDLGLYDFVSIVVKVPLPAKKSGHSENGNILRFSSSEHPQYTTHGLRFRKKEYVPVLLGPSVLRKSVSSEDSEKRAMQLLTLFKPWRTPNDLKTPDQTWTAAYADFSIHFTPRQLKLIENMDTLAASKEDRDRDTERKSKRESVGVYPRDHVPVTGDGERIINSTSYLSSDLFSCIFYAFDSGESATQGRLRNILGASDAANLDGCYISHEGNPEPVPSRHSTDVEDLGGLDEEVELDEQLQYVTGIRLNHVQKMIDAGEHAQTPNNRQALNDHVGPDVMISRVPAANPAPLPLFRIRLRTGDLANDPRWKHVWAIAENRGLFTNEEQMRAFLIVATHIIRGGRQLLMYIGGMGGTGKSHVIHAVQDLLNSMDR